MTSSDARRLHSKLSVFHTLAVNLAGLSYCKRLKIGCVVIPQDMSEVLAIGYNGPMSGMDNNGCRETEGNCGCIHSEANALIKLRTRETGLILIATTSPCEHCAGLIVNSKRIGYVLHGTEYRDPRGISLLRESGIVVCKVDDLKVKEDTGDLKTIKSPIVLHDALENKRQEGPPTEAQQDTFNEASVLYDLLKERKRVGNPVEYDVATHALMLVRNGWAAQKALDESQRTLDEAEAEGSP